ncbi:phosphoadenosine phosphosulfate reductase family protein [uncultured Sphingomonas sp.]|uniref:phosphoadenosine phosphosulfate reductase family protein n=1 Tax=uncultured Sphingomonas sp. TaxID=158754 RepID=UPI0025FDB8C9|nr:phosphoadenosine phosphosulfate reductase family protein [uncultured Sphingomonas sp.]
MERRNHRAVSGVMRAQHFVSISGGKDSTATACLAVERAERTGFAPRFLFADTGNEHDVTLEHVAYLAHTLGITIETVRADFSGRFAARRAAIARDWPKELRRKQHSAECRAACEDLAYAEKALVREECDCPIKVSPPVPDHLIARAVELMQPTGNPFLDMAMLHGRFPGTKSRFCTTELKLDPMDMVKTPIRVAGTPVVEWVGERADESAARAAKPTIEINRCSWRAPAVIYRPIHSWHVREVFTIAKRHGLKPNPLYLMGMGRVGCFCIMAQKEEVRQTALRFPAVIERIAEWEVICGNVARHANTSVALGERDEFVSSFLPTDKVPPDEHGKIRATIHRAVEWSKTSRGGRNFDLLNHLDEIAPAEQRHACSSQYGLCE